MRVLQGFYLERRSRFFRILQGLYLEGFYKRCTKGWVLGLHFKGFQIRNGEFTTEGGGSQTTKRNMGALPNAIDKELLSDECCLPCSETFPQHWLW